MDRKLYYHYEARARLIKALAHPSRLFIIDELARQERCVCELTGMIGADMSTVSRHLSILRAAGLVQDEKRGSQVYYRLSAPCVLGFFDCLAAVVESVAGDQIAILSAGR